MLFIFPPRSLSPQIKLTFKRLILREKALAFQDVLALLRNFCASYVRAPYLVSGLLVSGISAQKTIGLSSPYFGQACLTHSPAGLLGSLFVCLSSDTPEANWSARMSPLCVHENFTRKKFSLTQYFKCDLLVLLARYLQQISVLAFLRQFHFSKRNFPF